MREIKFRALYETTNGERRWVEYGISGKPGLISASWIIEDLQYTGLKDKNGVEIYEGDIVHLEGHKRNHKIIYTIGSFVGKQTKGKFQGYLDGLFFYRIEVIGNIYENKEII